MRIRTMSPNAQTKKPKNQEPKKMSENFYVVPVEQHNSLVNAAYRHRQFNAEESAAAAKFSAHASWHGIRTHNAIKALHLDHAFGSAAGGCVPDATIEKLDHRFAASQIWNAHKKLGQATAYAAIDEAIALADKYGIGQVSVDNAFHYLWGGGYVMEAAQQGYIAYTNCTAALAEVVPFNGKAPTLGTNPHSWGFPTTDAVGFPVVIDWATSVIAMGRVQQFVREGTPLPPGAAVDGDGNPTTDATKVAALTTFGAHKGYGLSVINELMGGFIGGSLPTLRSRWGTVENEKHTPAFYFQVIHPDAINGHDFAQGRSQAENVKAVLDDIMGHGNEGAMLPGQIEAESAKRSAQNNGLIFSTAEIAAFNEIAAECGQPSWDTANLKAAV
jgi:L-2-hydroxycarboxylate dehydrogenase (NAD+)